MASSFFGLYVSRDALQLAQKGLDITNHNMTNIKTEGYTRQRLDIMSVANGKGTLGYNNQVQLAGKGSEAIGVTQIRDKLLDSKVRKYSAELCDTGAKTSILGDIEDVLDDIENEETGLSAILGNFKDAFQSFSATGADRQDLSNVAKNAGESVINIIKNFGTRLNDIEIYAREDILTTNKRINAILKEMGQLNEQIKSCYVQMNDIFATRSGYQAEVDYGPLELKDKINLLCDELSQYMDISVTEEQNGTYTVCCNERDLVKENKYAKTDIVFTSEQPEDENDFVQLFISGLNSEKEWTKCQREEQPEYTAGIKNRISEINLLLDSSDIMDAFIKEREFLNLYDVIQEEIANLDSSDPDYAEKYNSLSEDLAKANAATASYSPIFLENWNKYRPGETPPSYAIEYNADTDTLKGGSLKGLFDMYNGKGCYADANENEYTITNIDEVPPLTNIESSNEYKGIKYYQQTIKSLAISIVDELNSIYDDYNTQAGDKAEADYRTANGIAPGATLTPTQQDEVDALREKVKFRLLDFEDRDNPQINGMKIADTWTENSLRCVHPNVTATGELDYNYDELDNVYLNKILSVFDAKHQIGKEPEEYTFEGFIANYGNSVGSQLEYEAGKFESTTVMYEVVSAARDEVSGVNMDEEGVNMMNYQKWYNAISRMINALDECLDKLINGTGRVGL